MSRYPKINNYVPTSRCGIRMNGKGSVIKAYLKVCRYEYFPAELTALFIPILLTADSLARFTDLAVFEGVVTFVILYLSGFLINAWTDREIDAKYQNFKSSIAWGVRRLGERGLKSAIAVHLSVSILLGLHISYLMESFIPIIIILVGIFFGFGYSIKPLTFKTRGVAFHMISLSLCCFFIPLVFLFYVLSDGFLIDQIVFASGFAMVHYALEVGNQIQDYEEDLKESMLTPTVRLGLTRSLVLALMSFTLGLPIMVGVLYYWFHARDIIHHFPPFLNGTMTILLISAMLGLGYSITFMGLYRMYRETRTTDGIPVMMRRVRSHINYALWQMMGITGLFFISLVFFISE